MDEDLGSPLGPSAAEIGVAALTIVHLVLIVVVVVQLIRGKVQFPIPIWGVFALICLPVVGPILVLSRQRQLGLS